MVKFRASAALGACYDCSHVASAAFSAAKAAKDHFAWQAQHLEHVMILGSFRVAGAALEARYDQKVACGCRKTCNRNVFRAFEKLK